MTHDDRVSVIIPTFNRAERVQRAVASVVAQSRPPDEIILVDDGSTDATEEIITRNYPQIRYIRQENRGISAARNFGIQNASGNWIAFLDADDEWLPRKLEKQILALKQNLAYRVCHTDEIWIRSGKRANPKKIHQKFGGEIFEKCLPRCVISPSSVIIHKQVFDQVGLFDPTLPVCEDYDLWLRVCSRFAVLYVDEPLIIKYGGHSDQLSRKYWGMDRFRIAALEKIIDEGRLDRTQKTAAFQALLEKIDVYLTGARKRGKKDEVDCYEKKRKTYQALLQTIP